MSASKLIKVKCLINISLPRPRGYECLVSNMEKMLEKYFYCAASHKIGTNAKDSWDYSSHRCKKWFVKVMHWLTDTWAIIWNAFYDFFSERIIQAKASLIKYNSFHLSSSQDFAQIYSIQVKGNL